MTTITTDPSSLDVSAAPASGDGTRLGDALTRVRRGGELRATPQWLLVAGAVMLPLGGLLILLGWYGASHTTRIWEEVPYLISGGLFGLFVAVTGGFCYFGYWLTRMLATDREILDVLRRIEANGGTFHGDAAGVMAAPAAVAGPASTTFVATRSGTMYHRPECQVVAERPAQELRPVTPAAGLVPCKLCLPAGS